MTAAETHALTLYSRQIRTEQRVDLAADLQATRQVLAMTRQAMTDLAIKADRLAAKEAQLRAALEER